MCYKTHSSGGNKRDETILYIIYFLSSFSRLRNKKKGGGKKRRTRLSFVHVPIDVKNNPNKNSVGEKRLFTSAKKTATGGKFLGKVSAILYLVSRFIPRLMLDRDKMERAR